jgi:hypothetical protein
VSQGMMNNRTRWTVRSMAALLLTVTTGCYVWQPTAIGLETLIPAEQPESVRVTLESGLIVVMPDPIIRNDSLVSTTDGADAILRQDVRSAEVREFSLKKTLAMVAGGMVLAVVWTRGVVGNGSTGAPPPDPIIKFTPVGPSACPMGTVASSC